MTWFRDRQRDGTLEIRPPYQRKPVWTIRQKSYLIESILLGYPIPEIFVHQTTNAEGETRYAIVDGQQRIRTVLQFIGADPETGQEEFHRFGLEALPADSQWRGIIFDEMEPDDKRRFYGFLFAVRLLDSDDPDEVRQVFLRLNRFLMQLKGQELRNASYQGPFVKLALDLADDDYWLDNRIVTPASVRRFGDVEFVSELLIGVMHGPQGGSARIIDDYYEILEPYDDQFPEQARTRELFDETRASVEQLFPGGLEGRWRNRADFYSLFVATAEILRTKQLKKNSKPIRHALLQFSMDVDDAVAKGAKGTSAAAVYARAVQKGVNDKKRRADRHVAIIEIIGDMFGSRAKVK